MDNELKQKKYELQLFVSAYIKKFIYQKIKYINLDLFDELIDATIKENIDNHLNALILNVQDQILQKLKQSLSKEILLQNDSNEDNAQNQLHKETLDTKSTGYKDTTDTPDLDFSIKDNKTFTLSRQAIKKMLK